MTHQATQHTPPGEGRFKRTLGSLEIFFIGFGAMIGFGWVTLTAGWLNNAGTLGAVSALSLIHI